MSDMIEEITQQIWQAAQEGKTCRVKIKGEPFPRLIHPYGICRLGKDKIAIICWQTLGFSHPGAEPGYRNLMLYDCESVEMLEETFKVREDFNPKSGAYREWVFHL
jgi:hypothetical protein